MNDWQLLNNWFVNYAIINLEIINWSLTKYENTIIKHIDALINQEKNIYSCIYKLLINDC